MSETRTKAASLDDLCTIGPWRGDHDGLSAAAATLKGSLSVDWDVGERRPPGLPGRSA
jgi:hypothetical protein